jgi:hypothetical protein
MQRIAASGSGPFGDHYDGCHTERQARAHPYTILSVRDGALLGHRVLSRRATVAARAAKHHRLMASAMPRAIETNSLGIITIVVVFCSAPTSVIICIRRNFRAWPDFA